MIGVALTKLRRGHIHTYTYCQDGCGVKILIIPFLVTEVDKK